MKKLDTSAVSTTVGMPIKGGTLLHIQQAYQEALAAIANVMTGAVADAVNYYILYGCVNTGTGLNYIISAGAIYYNGEVYLVDAVTFTAAAGQVAVCNFATTFPSDPSNDPVLFTDGITRNVHQIRKLVISAGTSGSGAIDFANLFNIAPQKVILSDLGAAYTVSFEQDKHVFCTAATQNTTISFNFTNAKPGKVVRIRWTYGAARTLTINTAAGQSIIRRSGNLAAVASANNDIMFCFHDINEAGNYEVSYNLIQY